MTRIQSRTALAAIAAAAAALSAQAAAQSIEQSAARGRVKSMQCVACHGPSGVSPNPMIPHLAGQNATYLAIQLEHFKTGERYNPLMTPVAQSLSLVDIADLAAYFSRIGPLAAAAEPALGLDE